MATLPTVGEQNVTDLRTTFDLADPGLNVDLPPRAMNAFAIIRTGPVGASWRSIAVMPVNAGVMSAVPNCSLFTRPAGGLGHDADANRLAKNHPKNR